MVSNCVLNLVATEQKTALFDDVFRVLRRGGRAVISDVVSATQVPERLRSDPELWSGCISGALQEEDLELLEPAEPVDPQTAPPFACAPPVTLTGIGPTAARRPVSGLTGRGGEPSACC